jgi:YggT family protein
VTISLVRDWVAAALGLYELCVFAYAVMSWFTGLGGPVAQVYSFLAVVCEPFVGLIRRLLPRQVTGAAGIDLSPLVAMLVLILAQRIVRGL